MKRDETRFFITQRKGHGCVSAYVEEAVVVKPNLNITEVVTKRNETEFVYTEDLFSTRKEALEELVSQAERLLKDVKAELEALEKQERETAQ